MDDPQVGDRFSEMYTFWMFVVGRVGDEVVTMEASAPCTFPKDGVVHQYTLVEFRRRFGYEHIPGYWVSLVDRGKDVKGWLPEPVVNNFICSSNCRERTAKLEAVAEAAKAMSLKMFVCDKGFCYHDKMELDAALLVLETEKLNEDI
jgi:hypothetical protein